MFKCCICGKYDDSEPCFLFHSPYPVCWLCADFILG